MKIVVTGGREYPNKDKVFSELNKIDALMGPVTMLIQGGCNHPRFSRNKIGADHYAVLWAYHNSIPEKTYWANWTQFGKAAGPMRNRLMLEENKEALVVAFPGGNGTADCVRSAKSMGMRVILIEDEVTQQEAKYD